MLESGGIWLDGSGLGFLHVANAYRQEYVRRRELKGVVRGKCMKSWSCEFMQLGLGTGV